MPTIDQRILIPAPPEMVWAFVSDLSQSPKWQADCAQVSFLTQQQQGAGTRWRCTPKRGHDVVLQVTAWYNGLGYEYTYVDGAPFKKSIGRLRLQDTAEGTVVQWTFSYEGGGRRIARDLEATMADSLRGLYRQLQNPAQRRELEPKSLMRDDPGVEARSQYKPRHPSVLETKDKSFSGDIQPKPPIARVSLTDEPPIDAEDNRPFQVVASVATPKIIEPPITQEDTKPRPAVQIEPTPQPRSPYAPPLTQTTGSRRDPMPPAASFSEPDFLDDLVMGSPVSPTTALGETQVKSDTQPIRPIPASTTLTRSDSQELRPASFRPIGSQTDEDAQSIQADFAASVRDALRSPTLNDLQPIDPPTSAASTIPEPSRELDDDTGSIWQVFGIPRPSETQERRIAEALRVSEAVRSEQAVDIASPTLVDRPHPYRMGLRVYRRRTLIPLRHPPTEKLD